MGTDRFACKYRSVVGKSRRVLRGVSRFRRNGPTVCSGGHGRVAGGTRRSARGSIRGNITVKSGTLEERQTPMSTTPLRALLLVHSSDDVDLILLQLSESGFRVDHTLAETKE